MDLTLARGLIKSAVESNKKFTEEAKVGIAYYENENDICKTGAAAINEVNNYLKVLKKSPLKSADNRIPTNWHKIFTDQKIGYLFTYLFPFTTISGPSPIKLPPALIKLGKITPSDVFA